MKKVAIQTFGCQMNEQDSHIMGTLLARSGYEAVESPAEADLIVVNTCTIRDKAYQKAVSQIGRYRRRDGSARGPLLAVTGCVASQEGGRLLKRFPFIDIILGPDHLAQLPDRVREAETSRTQAVLTDFQDLSDYEFPAPLEVPGARRVKAFVTIMKGCDNTCTFCIVPSVRGPEVSRSADAILSEIDRLAAEGVREVTLLGQNVNSYGRKGGTGGLNFAGLLRRIEGETGIARVRFTSPHPKDLSVELIEQYRSNAVLCPHIHLPVQSGSNRILKRMQRSYSREVFLRKIGALRAARPDISITTDLIVGFPGETDHDFEATLNLMREVRFDASYSFLFSPRPGTQAASLPDDVPPEEKKERLARLQRLQIEIGFQRARGRLGAEENVLVERFLDGDPEGRLFGTTSHGRHAVFHGEAARIGDIVKMTVKRATRQGLEGTIR